VKLKVIKQETCECGAEMVSMSTAHAGSSEKCTFACGLSLYVTGGNPTNYGVKVWSRCRNSKEVLEEKQRWLAVRRDVLAAIDASPLLPAEKDRFKGHVACEVDWRVRT
jgi:hypothetical protein